MKQTNFQTVITFIKKIFMFLIKKQCLANLPVCARNLVNICEYPLEYYTREQVDEPHVQ